MSEYLKAVFVGLVMTMAGDNACLLATFLQTLSQVSAGAPARLPQGGFQSAPEAVSVASIAHRPLCRATPLAGDATVHAPQKHAISWHVGKSRGHERKDGANPALLHVPQKAKGGTESAAAGLRAAAARVDHAAGAVRWPLTLDLRSADVDATDQ